MPSFNQVNLVGHVTRDPEMKYLPSNTAVCEFGVAMNRKWKDGQGQQKEEVCFVDVSAFGNKAETLQKYVKKGDPLLITGYLKLDQWEAQDGTKRSKLRVVADGFQFLGGNKKEEEYEGEPEQAPARSNPYRQGAVNATKAAVYNPKHRGPADAGMRRQSAAEKVLDSNHVAHDDSIPF